MLRVKTGSLDAVEKPLQSSIDSWPHPLARKTSSFSPFFDGAHLSFSPCLILVLSFAESINGVDNPIGG